MKKRELHPNLTHRIVVSSGYWARGATFAEAKQAYRKQRGKPFDITRGAVWAVTATTTVDDMGRFYVPAPFAQPADITDTPIL